MRAKDLQNLINPSRKFIILGISSKRNISFKKKYFLKFRLDLRYGIKKTKKKTLSMIRNTNTNDLAPKKLTLHRVIRRMVKNLFKSGISM